MYVVKEIRNLFDDHFDMNNHSKTKLILGMKIIKCMMLFFLTDHIKKILRKYNFIYFKHVTTHLGTKTHLLSMNI